MCNSRGPWLVIAVAALTLLTTPVSIAMGNRSGSSRTAARQLRTLKALEAKASALSDEVLVLTKRAAEIEHAAGREQAPTATGAIPQGPAGGDLVGTYPSPQIRPESVISRDISDGAIAPEKLAQGTVSSFNLATQAIGAREVAPGSLASADLAAGIFGAGRLGKIEVVTGPLNFTGPNSEAESAASCPAGTRMLAGGPVWSVNDVLALERSGLTINHSGPAGVNSWKARGRNGSSGPLNFFVRLLCLDP